MTLSEHEASEIREVAHLLDNIQFNVKQPWCHGSSCSVELARLRDRLKSLLPQPESLESIAETVAHYLDNNICRSTDNDERYSRRLRAALERRKAGK